MKKIITLLIAVGAFGALHAQTSKDEARRVILGQPKNGSSNGTSSSKGRDIILGGGSNDSRSYPNTYPNSYPSGSSRQAQIDQVNREYDAKVWSIRNNPHLTQAEKERMIRQLEQDRQRWINEINKGYKGQNGHRHDDDGDDDNHYKKDNGKHLGWEKGVGNPHRNGGQPGRGKGKGKHGND